MTIVNLVFRDPDGQTGWTWAETEEEVADTIWVYERCGSELVDIWTEEIDDVL